MTKQERRPIVQVMALPIALVLAQFFTASLWKHPIAFYCAMLVVFALGVHGAVRLYRIRSPLRRLVVYLGIALLVASLLPIWFWHSELTPSGVEHHAHTLWELVHVH